MMRFLNRAEDWTAGLLGFAILILVNVQILFRYGLSVSVPWTEEVSRLLFVWLVFIGAAIGWREKAMIVIDTLPELGGPRVAALLKPFVTIVSLLVAGFMAWATIGIMQVVWPTSLATVAWLSNGWLYAAAGVGFSLMVVHGLHDLLRARERRT
jgi:TRAP-type transport system small permease protein